MRHRRYRTRADKAPEAANDPGSRSSGGDAPRFRTLATGLLCTLLALCGSGAIVYALLTAPTPPPQPTAAQAGTLSSASHGHDRVGAPHLPASEPIRVRIASIGVDAAVDTLGLKADGTVQVPSDPDDAGWYAGSATPGQIGAAVLLGHVDFAATGPAVFYRLGELMPGAVILVARKDDTTAAFTVNAVREFPKSDFPTDEVYGPTDDSAQLRLITCGSWDSDQRKYTGNTVVFATLTPPARAAAKAAGPTSPRASAAPTGSPSSKPRTGGEHGPR